MVTVGAAAFAMKLTVFPSSIRLHKQGGQTEMEGKGSINPKGDDEEEDEEEEEDAQGWIDQDGWNSSFPQTEHHNV